MKSFIIGINVLQITKWGYTLWTTLKDGENLGVSLYMYKQNLGGCVIGSSMVEGVFQKRLDHGW